MYMHDGTASWLKMVSVFVFIGISVWWLQGAIGGDYTVLVIFALVGVILFAGGALFAHMNQQSTLNAITKFNAQDAQIDKYRQQTLTELTRGETALKRAASQIEVLDAKRITKLADQQAKLLTDAERLKMDAQYASQTRDSADTWTWDDDTQSRNSVETWE